MSDAKATQVAVAVATEPVVADWSDLEVGPLESNDPRLVPDNKQVQEYLLDGYTLTDFRTRNNEDAKDEAKNLRKDGTLLTAKLNLLQGWYGVLVKKSETKADRIAKLAKPIVPLSFDGIQFESTKDAREFARKLLEAAREAEYQADRAAAMAAKQQVVQA